MNETWKPVVGYEDIYEVSSLGNVKRIAPWSDGRKRVLREHLGTIKKGYIQVMLYKERNRQQYRVHRLVLAAFIGPIPAGHQVNHINGNKADNRLENIEYCTSSENNFHRYRVLRCPSIKGSKHHGAKVSESDVIAIRALRERGWKLKAISVQFNLSIPTVCWICKNKSWKHV